METIILSLIAGIGIAYFSIQNTTGVPLHMAGLSWTGIPLYIVVIGALLTGLLFAWIMSLVGSIGTHLMLRNRESKIHERDTHISRLEDKIKMLETENTRLKRGREEILSRRDDSRYNPSLIERLRNNFGRA